MRPQEVLRQLQANYSRALLIENSVSSLSCTSVLDTLRTLWAPGCPLELSFSEALLTGKQPPSTNFDFCSHTCTHAGIADWKAAAKVWLLGTQWPGATGLGAACQARMGYSYKFSETGKKGPPGTGKSYMGARLAQIFVEIKGRVLVVTTKNHALDEMLVRVGFGKKIHPQLQHRSLLSVMKMNGRRGAASNALREMKVQCKYASARLSEKANITCQTFVQVTGYAGMYTICSWLQVEWNGVHDMYQALSSDQISRADLMLVCWAARPLEDLTQVMAKPALDSASSAASALEGEQERWRRERLDANGIEHAADAPPPEDLRGALNPGIMITGQRSLTLGWTAGTCIVRRTTDAFSKLMEDIQPLEAEDTTAFTLDEEQVYRSVSVIGATVQGALQRMDAIAASEPRALVLEEAGEVPEAMLMALLRIPSLERCVMVGDHQQLRPAVNSYELQMQKNLDISCFERLVKLGMPVPCLRTQNRMRENLLPPVLQHYPLLQSNTESIEDLEDVPWLAEPLYWWVCESLASHKETSWCNHEQAHRAVKLASFLINQGAIAAPKITVLVPYARQLFLTRMLLRDESLCEDVGCSTIDQFQGDENEVIILCLVRCDETESRRLGFLGTVNRMIVATSRQKRALIIIGSSRCFGMHPEWSKLIASMKGAEGVGGAGQLGEALPLRCPRHPHKLLSVPDSRCFPASGCGEGCHHPLPCAQTTCQLKCHAPKEAHGFCKRMVTHTHKPCDHVFDYQCHAVPKDCPQHLLVALDCGHSLLTICGSRKPATALKCIERYTVALPCGHSIWLPCGVPTDGYLDPDFNACSSCLQQAMLGSEAPEASQKLLKIRDQVPCPPKRGCVPSMTAELIATCADATARLGLCEVKDIPMLIKALRAGRVPHSLAIAAVPDPVMWDHNASKEERWSVQKPFVAEQNLWRVVLRESGMAVPKEWMKQGLTLITAVSLLDVAAEGSTASSEASYGRAATLKAAAEGSAAASNAAAEGRAAAKRSSATLNAAAEGRAAAKRSAATLNAAAEGEATHSNAAAEGGAAPSNATVLSHQLGLLHKAGISNAHGLISVLKEAGDALYLALRTHDKSPLWYQQDEKRLASLAAGLGVAAPSITKKMKRSSWGKKRDREKRRRREGREEAKEGMMADPVTQEGKGSGREASGGMAVANVATGTTAAGTIVSHGMPAGTTDAGTIVSHGMAAGTTAAGTIVSHGMPAGTTDAGTIVSHGMAAGTTAAGTIVSHGMAAGTTAAGTIISDCMAAGTTAEGTIVSDCMAAGTTDACTILSDGMAAGTVALDSMAGMAVDSMAAVSLAVDSMAAGSLAADSLAVDSMAAGSLAADSLAVDNMAAGSFAADRLAVDSLAVDSMAAGSLIADSLVVDSMTAGSLAGNTMAVGSMAAGSLAAYTAAANITAACSLVVGSMAAGNLAADTTAAGSLVLGNMAADSYAADTTPGNTTAADIIAAGSLAAGTTPADTTAAGSLAAGTTPADTTAAGSLAAGTTPADTTAAGSLAASTTPADTTAAGSLAAGTTPADTTVAGSLAAGTTPADTTAADTTAAGTTPADTTAAGSLAAGTMPADTTVAGSLAAGTTPADTTRADTTAAGSLAAGTAPADTMVAGTTAAGTTPADTTVAGSLAAGTTPADTTVAGSLAAGTTPADTTAAGSLAAGTTPADTTVAGSLAAGTTPADTTAAGSLAAGTTPADTTVAGSLAAGTTPADTTVAGSLAAGTTPADTTPADTTAAGSLAAGTAPADTTVAGTTAAGTTAAGSLVASRLTSPTHETCSSPSRAGTTPYTVEEIERLCAMVFEDHAKPLVDHLRSSWGLPPASDVLCPPHLEVPKDYLYQASLAGSLYVSIDLRSADFHVLSLAVPGLIQEDSWAEWLRSTLDPTLMAKVPFLADLKPLRMRVLGKVAHPKNAALQSHCLRLLARLLVALGLRHAGDFACVDCVFRFSCDELCIKLRADASPSCGLRVSELRQSALKQLQWCTLLPTRLEVFHLQQLPFGDEAGKGLARGRMDGDDGITKLHLGHPLLRTSAQFVELPSVHDSAWAEPQHLCRPPEQRCDDSYFVRKMDLEGVASQRGTVFKHLPIWARPRVILDQMHERHAKAAALPAGEQMGSLMVPQYLMTQPCQEDSRTELLVPLSAAGRLDFLSVTTPHRCQSQDSLAEWLVPLGAAGDLGHLSAASGLVPLAPSRDASGLLPIGLLSAASGLFPLAPLRDASGLLLISLLSVASGLVPLAPLSNLSSLIPVVLLSADSSLIPLRAAGGLGLLSAASGLFPLAPLSDASGLNPIGLLSAASGLVPLVPLSDASGLIPVVLLSAASGLIPLGAAGGLGFLSGASGIHHVVLLSNASDLVPLSNTNCLIPIDLLSAASGLISMSEAGGFCILSDPSGLIPLVPLSDASGLLHVVLLRDEWRKILQALYPDNFSNITDMGLVSVLHEWLA
eukprot:gene29714-5148_t